MSKKSCGSCNGRGKTTCYPCNGTGTRSGNYNQNCTSCNGTREQTCNTCGGSGLVNSDGTKDCFITTATLASLNKKDDCNELNTFRYFRDVYVAKHYPEDVTEYYLKAPILMEAMTMHEKSDEIFESLWNEKLKTAYKLILKEDYSNAYKLYKNTMIELSKTYEKN